MPRQSLNKFAFYEALRGADLTHAEYRVLVNLSTFANGDLTNAHPGLPRLCEAAGVSLPTAKKALRNLTEKGWLVLTDPGGNAHWKGKANVYALLIPKGVTELAPSGSPKGVNDFQEGGKPFSEGGKSAPFEGGNSLTPHQKELPGPYTRELDQGSSHLSNAGASARGAGDEKPQEIETEIVAEGPTAPTGFAELFEGAPRETEPPPSTPALATIGPELDPALNPLGWIDQELPGGFWTGERGRARDLLASGCDYGSVRYAILNDRHARPRQGGLRRAHTRIDENRAQEGA
ncbi:helix-turn-helix domain-containing protein [Rhodococcus tibetensis]|uniref:Helix-turn-helix domain-containing protein n=1 Tax=Rhodococcus tibetensis TaxID=2965064 RepID=A0ABT1QDS9_9NOCA|nr:helix-turn-helix domain-containing protein [Rhodococcus sp. FXJ9.536]MCQ4120444.1 helix-turn-helix domain-containing protein [Rhodococcus sp. FXJ9.536]